MKPLRGYAIAIRCICGRTYFSAHEGTLHTCPECQHVCNLAPYLSAQVHQKTKGSSWQPKKARNKRR